MPWGLQWKCKFCVSRAISEYWQAGCIDGGDGYCCRQVQIACIERSQGCMGEKVSYCSRQVQRTRIRSSLDVLAENHLPALPISPAGSESIYTEPDHLPAGHNPERAGPRTGPPVSFRLIIIRQYPSAYPAGSSGLFCLSASCQRPPVTLPGRSP